MFGKGKNKDPYHAPRPLVGPRRMHIGKGMGKGKDKLRAQDFNLAPGGAAPTPGRMRLSIIFLGFAALFVIIGVRLGTLASLSDVKQQPQRAKQISQSHFRPDIVDRNGQLLATDIKSASAYADPTLILDVDEFVEKVGSVLTKLNQRSLRKKLAVKKRSFVWLKRGISPKQEEKLYSLGLPGLHFTKEPRRVYPMGNMAAHILGTVDIDNKALSGIERYIDKISGVYLPKYFNQSDKPEIKLALDLRVQHVLHSELHAAQKKYAAKAAMGMIVDTLSGEVIAMSSLPDYDPNQRTQALDKKRFDRVTQGRFELGSVFKALTAAMALDLGVSDTKKLYDARTPLKEGGFTIDDYHPQRRWLNAEDVFIHSSNIGVALMALDVGPQRHRAFLERVGVLQQMETELGQMRKPQEPKKWRKINTMTISYGHGLAVAPLQFVGASLSLVNGGYSVPLTFLRRSHEDGRKLRTRILKAKTSAVLRQFMRRNVIDGTGKRANIVGYRVGGKTGTAEKVINKRYDKNRLRTSFLAAFPLDSASDQSADRSVGQSLDKPFETPAYMVYVVLDEPQTASGEKGRPTAGVNAAAVVGKIIAKAGPLLGVAMRKMSQISFDESRPGTYRSTHRDTDGDRPYGDLSQKMNVRGKKLQANTSQAEN